MASPPVDMPGIPRTGDVLAGKYRVERVLGVGGMGVVLAAWHLVLERRVAVKFLLPGASDLPDAGARFLREAKAVANLEGEHVARVIDVGTLDSGAPYMVLEYLHGDDLGEVLKARGALPVPEAIDLFLQACEAIAEAHARGIIHRDLKPKNLFLTRRPDGTPLIKVLDFGLSKFLFQGVDSPKDASLTATGLIVGSIHYMSPEQVRSLKYADARTDIWALGVILYEMLAGSRPFRGDSMPAVTAAVMVDDPPPLSAFRRDVPGAIDALIARCLQKDPTRRVQTITEMARCISPFGSSRATHSFETIARLLPEPMVMAPAHGAAVADPSRPRAPLPSFSGSVGVVDGAGIAGVAHASDPRAALPSSSGAAAGAFEPSTQSLSTWGQTRRMPSSKATAVVLAMVGLVASGAAVLLWLLVVRAPADGRTTAAIVPAAAESAAGAVAAMEAAPRSTEVAPGAVDRPADPLPTVSATEPIAGTSPTVAPSGSPSMSGVVSAITPPSVSAPPGVGAPRIPGPSTTQTPAPQPPAKKTPVKKAPQDVMRQWD